MDKLNTFVVIMQDYGSIDRSAFSEVHGLFPLDYPLRCIEVRAKSFEDALLLNPDKEIFTKKYYAEYMEIGNIEWLIVYQVLIGYWRIPAGLRR